jgi:hypothetical protein
VCVCVCVCVQGGGAERRILLNDSGKNDQEAAKVKQTNGDYIYNNIYILYIIYFIYIYIYIYILLIYYIR